MRNRSRRLRHGTPTQKKKLPVRANFVTGLLAGILLTALREIYWTKPKSDGSTSPTPLSQPDTQPDGWHSIDVYYGDTSPKQGWAAQVHQDEAVFDLIGDNGYFIDLAANDAMELSNTYALEEHHGWKGLCIEPNPVYWYGLSQRKCQVVGALVGSKKEEVKVKFRGVYGGIVDKMDNKMADRKKEPDAKEETRFTAPLLEIFEKYNVPKQVDYLSLDVEGAEYLIMKDFPFDKYRMSLMTVERPGNELKELFEANGYLFLKDLAWWGETLWAHSSMGLSPKHPKVAKIPYAGKH